MGEEIIIEKDTAFAAVALCAVVERLTRKLSELLRLAKEDGRWLESDAERWVRP